MALAQTCEFILAVDRDIRSIFRRNARTARVPPWCRCFASGERDYNSTNPALSPLFRNIPMIDKDFFMRFHFYMYP